MSIAIGLAELVLAGLLFHRIVPIACGESRWSAVKVWAFALAIVNLGTAQLSAGLGYPAPLFISHIGHFALIVSAVLWLRYLRGAAIRGWPDVGKMKADKA